MATAATYSKAVKLIFLCVVWYTVSSVNNVVTKLILTDFPYPMTVTMVHLYSTSLYSLPVLFLWDIPSSARVPLRLWFKLILPLAIGKFFASVSSHISLWKVPVSYAHTVKATMPLFTVVLSWLIMRERPTLRIVGTLVPIITGVCIATVTEVSFNIVGLLSALSATLGFALQNIFSKKCLRETGIHHLRLLFLLAFIAALCMTPFWLLDDFRTIYNNPSIFNSIHAPKLVALLFIESLCGFLQNIVAFTVIAMVTPLSYAVANTTKRIAVISISLLTLHNHVTPMNVFGMGMAVSGVLAYNKAKLDHMKQSTSLPVTNKSSSSYTNGHLPHHGPNNHIFFGDDSLSALSSVGHMTPPAQHSSLSRTKYEDNTGNTIWRNV